MKKYININWVLLRILMVVVLLVPCLSVAAGGLESSGSGKGQGKG